MDLSVVGGKLNPFCPSKLSNTFSLFLFIDHERLASSANTPFSTLKLFRPILHPFQIFVHFLAWTPTNRFLSLVSLLLHATKTTQLFFPPTVVVFTFVHGAHTRMGHAGMQYYPTIVLRINHRRLNLFKFKSDKKNGNFLYESK